ncbi:YdgA family protein [Paenalcaligenes sp. Me131]
MSKKKIVLGSVVVLGAAYVGASWYIGTKTEAMIAKRLVSVNEKLAQQITHENESIRLEEVSYERGVFSSSAVYALKVSTEKRDSEIRFAAQYSHGPFPIAALSAGVFSPMLNYSQIIVMNEAEATELYQAANGEVPVKADSQVRFNGAVKSHITVAPAKVVSAKGTTLETSVAHLYLDVSKDFRAVDGSLDIDSIAINETLPVRHLRFEGAHLRVARTEHEDGVVSGQYKSGSRRFEFSSPAESVAVVMDNTVLQMSGTWSDQLISHAAVNYDLEALLLNGYDFGSITFGAELKNVDIHAERAWKQARVEFKDNPEVLKGYVQDLVKTHPEVSIRPLAWQNSGGESEITATVAFQPIADDTAPWPMIKDLSLNASLSRRMVGSIVKPTEAVMRTMVDRIFDKGAQQYAKLGLIQYDRTNATIALQYNAADGNVVLNGTTMSFDAFSTLLKESNMAKW